MPGVSHPVRTLAGLAAAVLIGTVAAGVDASPAYAGSTYVEADPSTVNAGGRVTIRASCGDDNTSQATVESDAFGRVIVMPDQDVLTGQVTVPGSKRPGRYPVDLQCQNGNTATTTLTVTGTAHPTRGPDAGGGGTASASAGSGGSALLVGGIAAIGLGAGIGLFAMRRRRAGSGA
ncbi:hypothetical protein O7621_27815 [Solwaraspora sp. WMMD937]|uniref:hypothetical protein n=1 Tax=Solwaraspora sp. WMMD937 TaxID=3016090 RepID=UPI00249BF2A9|nr:hypothetical protein [Solwaraspora sp. WMMD937]WFE21589.1 hypothetical protein O7621_27815 [Solwaraspora sp. WMMD937]